jgi:polyhydroxybutyrate depolymerase
MLVALPATVSQAEIIIDLGRGPIPVYEPEAYDPETPTPLVVWLHGYWAGGPYTEGFWQFILIPAGTVDPDGMYFWNATVACCDFYGSGVDDSGYLRSLIDEIARQLSVDPTRIYVAGYSNGGFMAYRMACDHAETIAEIVSGAGATEYDPLLCTPLVPVHVLHFHGTADINVFYNGGYLRGNPYPGAVASVEQWATYNGCSLLPDTTHANIDLASNVPGDETRVTRYIDGCNPGGSAELWSIVGGDHWFELSETFRPLVFEHLLSHPKDGYSVIMMATSPTAQVGGDDQIVSFSGEIRNFGPEDDIYDLTVDGVPPGWSCSYTTPSGTFSGPSTLSLASGETASFTLDIDSEGNHGPATVMLRAESQHEPLNAAARQFRKLNGLQVLLVDDDSDAISREDIYGRSLDAAGVSWGVWHRNGWGALTGQDLIDATAGGAVVWLTGHRDPSFDADDRAAIDAFLATGGDLFVSGPDIGYDLVDPGSANSSPETQAWYENTLHATYLARSALSATVSGIPGDPIGNGLTDIGVSTTVGPGILYPPGLLDGIAPGPGANTSFTYPNPSYEAAVRWESGGSQVVYFAFGFENLGDSATRDLVMWRILGWMAGGIAILEPAPTAPVLVLSQNVPNPFYPSTTIFYQLGEAAGVKLRVFDVNGRLVRTLVNGRQDARPHQVEWNGRDDTGHEVASGAYFYQLTAGSRSATRRLVVVR